MSKGHKWEKSIEGNEFKCLLCGLYYDLDKPWYGNGDNFYKGGDWLYTPLPECNEIIIKDILK